MSERSVPCGWCITGHHKDCLPKLEYYEKIWYCGCKTCYPNGVEEKEEKTNELVQKPIQEQEAQG